MFNCTEICLRPADSDPNPHPVSEPIPLSNPSPIPNPNPTIPDLTPGQPQTQTPSPTLSSVGDPSVGHHVFASSVMSILMMSLLIV